MGQHKSKLTPEIMADLVNHTEFSEEEIRLWFKSFKKDCPSGILSLREFQKLYNELFPAGDARAFAERAFRTFDTNNDGTIDFTEFMCALSVQSRGSFHDKLDWAYSMYDKDKDGHVTKAEMLDIITAIYKMVGEKKIKTQIADNLTPQQRVDGIFEKMDKDHDEQITMEEFKIAASQDPSLVMLLQFDDKSS